MPIWFVETVIFVTGLGLGFLAAAVLFIVSER